MGHGAATNLVFRVDERLRGRSFPHGTNRYFLNITISNSVLWLVEQHVNSNWHARVSLPPAYYRCPVVVYHVVNFDQWRKRKITDGFIKVYLLNIYWQFMENGLHIFILLYNIENFQVELMKSFTKSKHCKTIYIKPTHSTLWTMKSFRMNMPKSTFYYRHFCCHRRTTWPRT